MLDKGQQVSEAAEFDYSTSTLTVMQSDLGNPDFRNPKVRYEPC